MKEDDSKRSRLSALSESWVRHWWDAWTETISENRSHSDGWVRLKGFLQQLATETIVYFAIGNGVALFALLIHALTPFVLMPNPWVVYPGLAGFAMTVLYYIGFDTWLRPEDESAE